MDSLNFYFIFLNKAEEFICLAKIRVALLLTNKSVETIIPVRFIGTIGLHASLDFLVYEKIQILIEKLNKGIKD